MSQSMQEQQPDHTMGFASGSTTEEDPPNRTSGTSTDEFIRMLSLSPLPPAFSSANSPTPIDRTAQWDFHRALSDILGLHIFIRDLRPDGNSNTIGKHQSLLSALKSSSRYNSHTYRHGSISPTISSNPQYHTYHTLTLPVPVTHNQLLDRFKTLTTLSPPITRKTKIIYRGKYLYLDDFFNPEIREQFPARIPLVDDSSLALVWEHTLGREKGERTYPGYHGDAGSRVEIKEFVDGGKGVRRKWRVRAILVELEEEEEEEEVGVEVKSEKKEGKREKGEVDEAKVVKNVTFRNNLEERVGGMAGIVGGGEDGESTASIARLRGGKRADGMRTTDSGDSNDFDFGCYR